MSAPPTPDLERDALDARLRRLERVEASRYSAPKSRGDWMGQVTKDLADGLLRRGRRDRDANAARARTVLERIGFRQGAKRSYYEPDDAAAAGRWWGQLADAAEAYQRGLVRWEARQVEVAADPPICPGCGHLLDLDPESAALEEDLNSIELSLNGFGWVAK